MRQARGLVRQPSIIVIVLHDIVGWVGPMVLRLETVIWGTQILCFSVAEGCMHFTT